MINVVLHIVNTSVKQKHQVIQTECSANLKLIHTLQWHLRYTTLSTSGKYRYAAPRKSEEKFPLLSK
ncbi:hypothetical protein [Azospirillum argentinense]